MTPGAERRYDAWRNGRNHWASVLDQVGGAELDELVAEVGAEADQLPAGRAAFHIYDLILNAGEQGGAERVGLPLLRTLARRAGGYSHLARPASPRTSTQTVYRGGDDWRRCSWTPDRCIAQAYASSEREGDRRLVAAPVWRFEAPPGVLLAVVPAALAGGRRSGFSTAASSPRRRGCTTTCRRCLVTPEAARSGQLPPLRSARSCHGSRPGADLCSDGESAATPRPRRGRRAATTLPCYRCRRKRLGPVWRPTHGGALSPSVGQVEDGQRGNVALVAFDWADSSQRRNRRAFDVGRGQHKGQQGVLW